MKQATSYVIFDVATGRILATHSRLDAESGENVVLSDADVLSACGLSLDDKSRARAKVMAVDAAQLRSRSGLHVNTKRKELVPSGRVELVPSKAEIRGDGEDSVDIEIRVVHASGELDAGFDGSIKVSTQRGRLSESGGIVQAKDGVAKISLRSVPETIDRVRITARDVEGLLNAGRANVAFI